MNIQALPILIDEDGDWQNGDLLPFDLQCNDGTNDVNKIITGVYATILDNVVTEVLSPYPSNAKYITKIINPCTEAVSYHRTDPGPVIDLLTYTCPHCSAHEVGELKTYVKQFNMENENLGDDTFVDPLFLNIMKDASTGLANVDVLLDMNSLYENAAYNWFTLNDDTIQINQPLTDGVQLTIKFNYY